MEKSFQDKILLIKYWKKINLFKLKAKFKFKELGRTIIEVTRMIEDAISESFTVISN